MKVRATLAWPIHLESDLQDTVFISEITARAFIIADSNKRRTLSRSDIAKALSKSDQFDFLIDIVPRDDAPFNVPGSTHQALNLGSGSASNGVQGSGESSAQDQVRLPSGPLAPHIDVLQHGQAETENEDEDEKAEESGIRSSEVLDQVRRHRDTAKVATRTLHPQIQSLLDHPSGDR